MLNLPIDEVCLQSYCQKFPYDLPRSWCFPVSWLLGFGIWFWCCCMGGNFNLRRNRFIRMEASLDKDMPIVKQVAIQPVSTPATNHQALFTYPAPPILNDSGKEPFTVFKKYYGVKEPYKIPLPRWERDFSFRYKVDLCLAASLPILPVP